MKNTRISFLSSTTAKKGKTLNNPPISFCQVDILYCKKKNNFFQSNSFAIELEDLETSFSENAMAI